MGFWDDLAKDLSLWAAVQASKDKDGKPDPFKAAGMAAGMGNFSFSDQMRLGAMLGSQGAFDDDDDTSSDDFDDDWMFSSSTNKYEWRETCEDGSEYGIDPEDFETEEEYLEALEEASSIPTEINIPIKLTFSVECPALDKLDAIKESDYPNKRLYEAACKKVKLETGLLICSDDELKNKEMKQCDFILNNYKTITAANYLSVKFGEFLYAQAVKENFTLPKSIDIPDEDIEMKTSFEEVFREVYEVDKKLAFEIWKWCLKTFAPYKEYSSFGEIFVTREIVKNAYMLEEGFLSEVAKYIIKDAEFGRLLMEYSPQVDFDYGEIFYALLQNNQTDLAKELFIICVNKKMDDNYLTSFISGIIGACSNYDELETMELFNDLLFPIIEGISNKKVQRNIKSWQEKIQDYIEDLEDEVSFVEAMEKACEEKGVKYENEHQDALDFLTNPNRKKPPVQKKQNNPTIDAEERQKILDDKTIYTYCSVVFQETNHPYHYRTDDENIKIGDKVIVPVGPDNEERIATVVSIEKHMRISVPFPVDKTKKIIRKIEE